MNTGTWFVITTRLVAGFVSVLKSSRLSCILHFAVALVVLGIIVLPGGKP
jgi:hypothetical protein